MQVGYRSDRTKKYDLLETAVSGYLTEVVYLLNDGVDVNGTNWEGQSALLLAAWKGQREVCDYLIKAGANVNTTDKCGTTPLREAAIKGHADICTALVTAGAAVNQTDNGGRTPLIYAAMYGHAEVCTTLVAAGAAVNLKDGFATALYYATKCNYHMSHTETVWVLLNAGADIARADEYFFCPRGWGLFLVAGARGMTTKRKFSSGSVFGHDGELTGEEIELWVGIRGMGRACSSTRARLACVRTRLLVR